MRVFTIIINLVLLSFAAFSQNKMGYTWIVGFNGAYAEFDGTASAPTCGQLYPASNPNTPLMYFNAHSNICDSVNGRIILSTGGMILFDSLGYIVENGDSLQPDKAYAHNCCPADMPITQGSLILPSGKPYIYYVFIPTVSDSLYNLLWTNPNGTKAPFDLLRYNVVNMNLNSGNGKVVEKSKVLLKDIELNKVGMQACRHANGKDWWLFKHALDTNTIYKFLVTEDSIKGPFIQTFAQPLWGEFDLYGQSAFSSDGKKYGVVLGKVSKLFLADFDRCSGLLSNPKVYNIPVDSTTNPYWDSLGVRDTATNGIAFSANNQYVYISKRYNIYQLELNQPDSNLAWYRVKHGYDTSWLAFEYYGQMYRAPNNRIYIGKVGGSFKQFSVIDNPDNKGAACNFCRKCFRVDTAGGGLSSPPNMPDYELGPDTSKPCWPLAVDDVVRKNGEVKIYPNPANSTIIVEYTCSSKGWFELRNGLGQILLSTELGEGKRKVQLQVNGIFPGIYYYRCSFEGCATEMGKLSIVE